MVDNAVVPVLGVAALLGASGLELDARNSRLESSDVVEGERERVLKVGVAILIDIRSGSVFLRYACVVSCNWY